MNFQIKEKLIDLNDSLIKFIESFVFLPQNKLLVFGKDSAIEKHNKYYLLFEVWDLKNNYVINEGKLDIYAIAYICPFTHYKEDYVVNIRSLNGQRSMIMFDFITNNQTNNRTICKDCSSSEINLKHNIRETQLFCFSESSYIVFLEVLYYSDIMQYSNNRDEHYLYNFLVFKENEDKIQTKFKVRRDIVNKIKEKLIILKGNDRNLLIMFDYNENEIILWNFLKNYEEIKYISMNFKNFKVLKALDLKTSILFVLKDKTYKHLQIFHLNLSDNRCIMNNLFSIDNFEKNIDFTKISSNKVFFFERYNKYFMFILMKFKNSIENTHYFIYEFCEDHEKNDINKFLNHKYVLKLNFEKNSINNYFFKQKQCFDYTVCLTKIKNTSNPVKNEEKPQTMRVFSLITNSYDRVLEQLKLNFLFLMKKEGKYDENTIKMLFKRLFP